MVTVKKHAGLMGRRLPAKIPRQNTVACFRLATGNHYLLARHKKCGVTESDTQIHYESGLFGGEHFDTWTSLEAYH